LEKEEIITTARKIVFGSNDGSISTLTLLAGVTGGALSRGQILIAGAISMGYRGLNILEIGN